ncbi:ABC transporter ATP-binding protein [Actinoplanes sp. TBRC 11911]|uniref:ABC transporter ATP-binding protein n=1 Tax=Actinoplanes sp. TBRC 11911 TaxID=2729386 RepID=UPI00145D92CA|nr:ABC transporter ATP-binding protein [Actinoplanes sp. TBRC 11911]NMO55732.1 ABC transporter ATP-binding protein [Actinoplanes sp. TBRC 11911]
MPFIPLAVTVAGPSVRAEVPALAAGAGLNVLQVLLALAQPWPLAYAVDQVIGAENPRPILLVVAAAATVGLSAVSGLVDMAAVMSVERAAERMGARLRARLFDHAVTRSLRWHDRMPSGELLSRLTTDVGRMLDAVVALVEILVPGVIMLVTVLVILLFFDLGLALVAVAVLPPLALLAIRQRRRVRAAQQDARAESGRLAATTTDLMRNVRAVQAFGRTDRAARVFGIRNSALLRTEVKAIDVSARWAPLADVVLAVGAGLVLVVGGREVLAGQLTTGELLVVVAYLADLYSPVRALTRLSSTLAKASASAVRVAEVLDSDDAIVERPDATTAPMLRDEVRFHSVGFGYDRDRPVLHDFDLRIRAGETVALIGPSGAGKSTTLHLLLRLYDVESGSLRIDGVDVRDCKLQSLRERIAFVPQDPWLLDGSLAENIAFGSADATRADVLAASRAALVDEFAQRLPDGYDTSLGEGGVRLSGGQRRRVALARAAISNAPLVLLDEPTASLDPAAAASIMRAIRSATADRTVLLVTHDQGTAAIADRVVNIEPLRGGGQHGRPDSDAAGVLEEAPRQARPQPQRFA